MTDSRESLTPDLERALEDRLKAWAEQMGFSTNSGDLAEIIAGIEAEHARAERLAQLDREAATHVESVICMRTEFTGEPPYVGWKGLGLALKEALDYRDALESQVATLREALEDPQWKIAVDAIELYNDGARSDLVTLGIVGIAVLKLEERRRTALNTVDGDRT